MNTTDSGRGNRVFGLDVVRAAAVGMVLACHCGDIFAAWFGTTNFTVLSYGGYFGVELFFVLSGLLIGGLLIEQLDRPTRRRHLGRAWLIFMVRRWMRTLPLYYLWIGVLAVLWAPVIWGAADGSALGGALLRYVSLTQNLAWPMREPDFFDVSWSLAVEEWFYLGFSALLLGLAALVSRRAAFFVAVGVFLGGPIALRWWLRGQPGGGDHIVLYWLDSIALGIVAAWVAARHPRVFGRAEWLLPVGGVLLWFMFAGGFGLFGMSGHWRRTLDVDLAGVTLLCCLPAACRWRDASGQAADAVRMLSRLSYGLYLIHLSVLVYVNYQRSRWGLSPAASVVLSVGMIGGLSYGLNRWLERPILARRPDDRAPAKHSQSSPRQPSAEQSQEAATWGGA